MKKIIIYGSQYGSAKQYAEALAEETGIDVRPFEEVTDINAYDTVVYIGSIYAGGVLGLKKTFRGLTDCGNKKIIIATVGLADPDDKPYTDTLKSGIKNQLPAGVYDHAQIFHLRGGIDYSRLSFKHKTMLALLYRFARGLPEEKRTADMKAMVETYDKQISFVDISTLQPIIKIM